MDDFQYGARDKRGNWAPHRQLEVAPFWTGKFSQVGRWLVGYVWLHNTIFMAVTLAYWYLVLPGWTTMKTMSWDWALWLYAVNAITRRP